MRRVLFLSLIFGFVFVSGAWCIDDPNDKSLDDNSKIVAEDDLSKFSDDNFKIVAEDDLSKFSDDNSKIVAEDNLSKFSDDNSKIVEDNLSKFSDDNSKIVEDDLSKFSDDNFKILDDRGEWEDFCAGVERPGFNWMNVVTEEFDPSAQNKREEVSKCPVICYKEDDEGNSIWHVLVQGEGVYRFGEWVDACFNYFRYKSDRDDVLGDMLSVAFLDKNNDGETALAIAVRRQKFVVYNSIYDKLRAMGIGGYEKLIKEAAKEADLPYKSLLYAFENAKELSRSEVLSVRKGNVEVEYNYRRRPYVNKESDEDDWWYF